MIERYKAVYESGEAEIVEKKSRFIATVRPVETEDEAISFIAEMKKKYYNATHNCSAYVIGVNNETVRCSDDGEPSGTAGKPMLDVMLRERIHNAAVVVTRYFGGTLLGTGGLVRAYSKAVQAGIQNSVVIEKILAKKLRIITDYNGVGKLNYIAGEMELNILDTEYTEHVVMTLAVVMDKCDGFCKKVIESTNGKAKIEEMGEVYFAEHKKEILLFEK